MNSPTTGSFDTSEDSDDGYRDLFVPLRRPTTDTSNAPVSTPAHALLPRQIIAWRGLPAAALAAISLTTLFIVAPTLFSPGPVTGFLASYAPVVALAVASTFPLLVGGIDLSVGPVLGLSSIMTVLLSSVGTDFLTLGPSGQASVCTSVAVCEQGLPNWIVLLAVLLVGGAFGLINGLAVTYLRLQPLITTLATGFIAGGLGLYLFPRPGGQVPLDPVVQYTTPAVISAPLVVVIAIPVLAYLVMRTRLGVYMRAIGSDRTKAYASGVAVNRVTVSAYTLCGVLAGLGGVLFTLNVASADPTVGVTLTLSAIAAAILGGTALRGGWAEPFGPAIGALALGIMAQLVSALQVPQYYTQVVTGVFILVGLGATQTLLRFSKDHHQ